MIQFTKPQGVRPWMAKQVLALKLSAALRGNQVRPSATQVALSKQLPTGVKIEKKGDPYSVTALGKRFFWSFVAAKIPIPGLDFLITYPQMKELQKEARLADIGRTSLIAAALRPANTNNPTRAFEPANAQHVVAVSRPETREVAENLARRRFGLFARRIFNSARILRPPLEQRAVARRLNVMPGHSAVATNVVRLPGRFAVSSAQRRERRAV
ncbi:MAG: hypothetical protein V1644_03380 [Candidatus Micrarchaeota archaeon]